MNLFIPAPAADGQTGTRGLTGDKLDQLLGVFDLGVVDLGDDVPRSQSRTACGAILHDAGYQYALCIVQAEGLGQFFRHILPLLDDLGMRARVEALRAWSVDAFRALSPVMAHRQADGCIRECHGDMHLGNMALVDERIIIFDGIEFNDNLRWMKFFTLKSIVMSCYQ